ncbi:MAG: shikimate kinase [Corallococcus sp.]|nr:shikimate kinase [Corallococcus sp.]MCM1360045.1 shikimate kinase [Corallococcus sp.]MCM1395602.1 shikimate kinase [Corallococcus sp.]
MKILLIGFASSGKSTVGKLLAEKLHWNFYDSDVLVEQTADCSVAQIFSDCGEEYFRNLENKVLQRLTLSDNAVVALGGGSVLCADFMALAQNSTVVWLQVSPKSVAERLAGDTTRPLFDGLPTPTLSKLVDQRTPLYKAVANVAVTTDGKTPQEVVQEIARRL